MAWLDGYSKRKELVLTGGASGAQTDFQLELTVAYAAAMQGDFDDLRFTQANGTTLIDAWLDTKVNSTSAVTWAEFPTTPANTVEQTYYMYYGNGSAVSDWDIVSTFVFGDDFEVAGIGDWTTAYGSPDYDSTTQARSPTHSMQCSNAGVEGGYISQTASDNIAFDCWVYVDSVTTRAFFFGHGDGTDVILLASIGQDIKYYDTAWQDTGVNVVLDAWKKLSVYDFDWTAGTFKMSYDGNEASCNIRQSNAADPNRITLRMENAVTYYDDVRVRKYATGPPTYAFGSEESVPGNPYWYYNMLRRRN